MQEATIENRQVRVSEAERVQHWLSAFEDALRRRRSRRARSLFVEESHWRDLFALTWNVTPTNRRARNRLTSAARAARTCQARTFRIAEGHTPPRRVKRTGVEVIEAIFQFQTAVGRCLGVLRLPAAQPDKAWTISTSLRELKGHEEPVGDKRPDGTNTRIFGGEAWGGRRAQEQQYEDREPAVLIVGGGHNGLYCGPPAHARCRLAGGGTPAERRRCRRNRYAALALHNEIQLNHMPYMPFPASWPKYLPKDMLGDWLEAYAMALECNVWTSTTHSWKVATTRPRAVDGARAACRWLRTRAASASPGVRQRHRRRTQAAGHAWPERLQGPGCACAGLRQRRALAREERARAGCGQQRPRHRAGSSRPRRES